MLGGELVEGGRVVEEMKEVAVVVEKRGVEGDEVWLRLRLWVGLAE